MVDSLSHRQVIELKAGGPDDPDGSRAAAVLGAYFHAEHMRAFRQLIWRQLAIVALAWLVSAALVPAISRDAFIAGLALLVTVGVGAAASEWRAAERLGELLRSKQNR